MQNGGGFSNAGLVEIGGGTLNFALTYTQSAGETRLDGGDLQANPTLNGGSLTGGGTVDGQLTINNATIAPGLSADIIVVAGDLFLNPGSVTNIEIESTSGPGPGGHDQIQVNGTANLDGTLNVTLLGGFEPVGADNFTAITALSGVVGTFATENAPAGKILTVDYNSNDVVLSGIIDNVFTIFWDNQTGNDLWTDPLNWNTDLLPVPADDVFIGIVDGQGVFITSGVQSISSVLSDEDIIINGGTLTIANNSQLNGNLTVGNSGASILNGAGDVTVAGLTVWSGNTSTIGGSGTLFADGGLAIDFGGGTSRNLDRTIEMSGTNNWTATGGSNLNGTGQVVNLGTLNATNSSTINVNTGFDNTVGTITKSAGAGSLTFNGAFNNDNQVTVDAGRVSLASTNAHTGVFTLNAGGTLETNGGTSTMTGGTVSGLGTVLGTSGVLVIDGASTYNVGDTQINGGTITFNTNVATTTLTVGPSGAAVLNGTGDVTVAGLTVWSGNTSTIGGSGTLFADGGLAIDFGGGTNRNLDRTIEMSGTNNWTATGGSNLNGTGQVVNLGTLNATNSSTINVNTGFDNTVGTITKSAGAGSLTFNGAFNNDNQVTVDAGRVSLASTNAHTGVFTLNAGGTLETNGGTSTMTGGTVSGLGTVLGTSGVLVIDGASTYNVGDTQINGGTITFNTNVATTTLTVGPSGAAVLNGTGDVTVAGLTVWSGNTSTIGGSGTLFADGGLAIDFGGGTNRNLDRTIEMSGTNNWTATGGSNLNGTGQVVNLGTLNATNSSTINVNTGFDNQGTFNKSGAGTFAFNGIFTNSGLVDAQNAITSFTNTFTQTAGTTELSGGTINATNPMSVNGGSVIGFGTINGDVNLDAATLSPGSSPEILNVDNLTLTVNSVFELDVDGITPGVGGHDQVNVTNNATIAGTLNVNLGFAPTEGDSFDFITCGGTCSGTFDIENLPADFLVNYDPAFTQLFFSTCTGSICWDGGGGDFFWANALNWSTDALPGVADDVVIDFGGLTVDLDDVGVTHTISSLFSNDNLTLTDGTLSISNVATINGDLTLAGGNLDGAADVTLTGLTSWPNAASTIAGGGTLFATGGLDINFGAGTNRTFSRDIELDGTSTWTASGGSSLFTGAQQVTNRGTLAIGNTGGTVTISTTFFDNTATGTIDKSAGAGSLTMSGFYSNTGDFIAGPGGIRLNNANTHSGDFIVGAGAALLVDGAATLSGGSVSGLGSVTSGNPGSVLVVNGPTIYDVGSTTISGGTITFNTDADTDTLSISGGSTGTLNGSGDVTVSGTTAWFADGTTIGGSGTLFADGGLTLAMAGGATRTLDRTVQMSGTSAWSTTGLSTVNGNGKFINTGTINATNAGGSITVAPELDNLGTINVLTGDLILTNNGAHASNFNISGGAVLDFLSGIHDFLDNAVFAGGGQVDVNGATLNLPNAASGLTFSANTTLNASSGSITGVGDVSFDTPGTTHTIDAAYNVSGTTTVNGTNTKVDVSSTATFGGLMLSNGGDADLQAATIGTLSMGGAGNDLTAAGALSTTTANLGSGCTVAGTGSWASNGGFSSSGTTIGLGFTNTSTMSADSGVTSFTNGYTQNAGLTRLNGGDVTVGGGMNLNGGSLSGTGDINGNVSVAAAAITPGTSPGLLTINGNLTLGAGSVVNAELEGTNPVPVGGQFDVIHVTGTADLDGTLNVSFPGTFEGTVGNTFDILQVDNGFINPNPPLEFNTIAGPVTHTFGASIVPGLLPFGENFQLQILSLFGQPLVLPPTTEPPDEIVILEQNLVALITQFAISEQEEALKKALPGVTCK